MLEIGDQVDRFEVEAFLGEGGLARVYKVRHRTLGSRYALKLMVVRGERLSRRLVREGRIQAQLSHPNVVTVTDIIEHEGYHGLLMEFVEGRSLDRLLGEAGAPPLDEALALFCQVLAGVTAAHEAGVLHRDLKPGNILLTPEADGVVAKVTDFGIAKLLMDETPGGGDTLQSDVLGTPGYMAPEQAADPTSVDARADVYSLGAILYGLVTGRPPFLPGPLARMLSDASLGRFPPVREVAPDVPEAVAAAVERCLAPDPADRFPDCRALAAALVYDPQAFAAQVGGERPAVLHLPGARSRAGSPSLAGAASLAGPGPGALGAPAPAPAGAETWTGGGQPTAVPELEPGPPPSLSPPSSSAGSPTPPPEPGPSGKWLFIGTAALVVAVLAGTVVATWMRTGSFLPDPARVEAARDEVREDRRVEDPARADEDPGDAPEPTSSEGRAALEAVAALPPPVAPTPAPPPEEAVGASTEDPPGPAAARAPAPAPGDEEAAVPGPAPEAAVAPAPPPAEEPAVADAGEAAVGPAAPPPEAAAPALPALAGTWKGKLGGKPLTIRILSQDGARLDGEVEILVGTTFRTFRMAGRVGADGGVSLAEEGGQGWSLRARAGGGVLAGDITPPGRKRGQAFEARWQ